MESFEVQFTFLVPSSRIFDDYLSSEGHSNMTGGEAEISNTQGAGFTAWDGYIEGVNLEIGPAKYIKQAWRTSEFNENDEDSILELSLQDNDQGGCIVTLTHSNIPDGQGDSYKQGWFDHYFQPMEEFYSTSI